MTVNEVSAKDAKKAEQKRLLRRYLSRNGTQLGIIGVFALVWLFFILFAPNTFLSSQIYAAFMATVPFFGIIALPLTMVIIAGEMDLSFPAIMAISMVAFIFVFELFGSVLLALIGALLMGVIAGLLNGALVVWIGIPSLVVTIGTQFFWRGASLVIRNGTGFSLVAARDSVIYKLLVGKTFGYIPNQFIWMVIAGITSWLILNRTRLGAHIYLIGDNEKSAELMGVNTRFTRVMVFVIVGVASAFAGVLASLHVSYFWPSLGDGYLLETLAAVFLGGTSVFGGVGTILGTFLGSYIIGAIEAAIVAIGLTGFWTQLIYGLIIIVSVSLHAVLRKRMK
jgi:simple sugar transport system permease protein